MLEAVTVCLYFNWDLKWDSSTTCVKMSVTSPNPDHNTFILNEIVF